MIKKILATLSIIPSMLLALFIWIISLPQLLYEIPKETYYRIAFNKIVVKVRENSDGTYTVRYKGQEKTLTKEEFEKKTGTNTGKK